MSTQRAECVAPILKQQLEPVRHHLGPRAVPSVHAFAEVGHGSLGPRSTASIVAVSSHDGKSGLRATIRRSQHAIWFQVALVSSTTLRSPEPARATGGRPTFARKLAKVPGHDALKRSLLSRRVSTVAREDSRERSPSTSWRKSDAAR